MREEELARYQPFFGVWQLGHKLGSGTFGDVYSIHHDEDKVRLYAAMKVLTIPSGQREVDELRSSGMGDSELHAYYEHQVRAFINEISIMRQFRGHPNIVCFEDHAVIEHRGKLRWDILIRMERLEPLDHYLKRIDARLRNIVQLWFDVATALRACHEKGILHRDIKPDNILVSADGCFKLVDFGIAGKLMNKGSMMAAVGTPPYMAPEVRNSSYDGRADIYSLGVVVYQLLNANRYPFLPPAPKSFTVEDRTKAIERRFAGEQIPAIPGIPAPVMRLIQKSLSPRADSRVPTAARLQEEIRHLHLDPAQLAIPLFDQRGDFIPVMTRARGKRSRRPLVAALLALLAIVVAGIVILIAAASGA